jgi:ABC-2 type transport system ATP-binding protein
MILLSDITKKYAPRTILNIHSLEIPKGIFWIKGNNGSGKTTFMKIIAGINPFEGQVEVNGFNLKSNPIGYRKEVSYCEAEPLFPEFLTGIDLIRFAQQARQAPDNQVQELITHFDIANFVAYPVGTYSSGMLKKLSLLLGFIGEVSLVLLDEPLITLDDDFLPRLLSVIQLRHQQGTSFLISSHQELPDTLFKYTGILKIENQTVKIIQP